MSDARPAPPVLTGLPLLGAGLLLGLGNFMVVLDTTIANVSVPHIAGGLAVSPSQGTWVITSYSVAEAVVVPLTGWLVQRFGGVRVFAAAMLGFALFSFACGLAPTFGLLVACRVAQGFCGGPIMPTSQTLLVSIFPPRLRPQAMGLWAMTTVAAPIAGPLLGGRISDGIGWSWIFLINVPIAIALAFGVWATLRDQDAAPRRVPVDYVGLALLIVWVGALQIMLDKGKELEWFASGTIVALAVVAAVGFVTFLIWELTSENPIVNLRVFRHRAFVVAVAAMSLTFGVFFATIVLIPLWLQTSLGYTATTSGNVSAMQGVLAVFMSPIAAGLMRRYDARLMISAAVTSVACVAFWRSQFTTDIAFWNIGITFLVQGGVMPFYFVPSMALVMASVPPEETAAAAGLSNFLRTSFAAFGAAIMTTYWDHGASVKRGELVGRLHDVPGVIARLTGQGLSPPQAAGQIERMVQLQATMLATDQLFFVSGVILLFTGMIIWLAPRAHFGAPTEVAGH